ncbi:acetyltransferase [Pelagibacterales bacterium SAG-MED22]|nr:acetyltransferase [Pelagibacterales bacterium SAG-MED22]
MTNIIILGVGDFAREVYCWIKQSEKNQNIIFKGFLDDKKNCTPKLLGLENYYLGSYDVYIPHSNDYFILAISKVNDRELIYRKFKNQKYKFFNYIHESAIIGREVQFGEGNIVCPNSVFTTNINIGNCNIFNINCTIGHDVKINSFNTFNSHCDITGYANINNNNFFGSRSTILPKSKIGSNNKIAAGSVIYKGIKDNCLYLGNPAIKISENI